MNDSTGSTTNSTMKELLQSQTSATEQENKSNYSESKNAKNDELIKRIAIPNTPFLIVGYEEKGYMLALGKYRLTDFMPSADHVMEYFVNNQWFITLSLIEATFQEHLFHMHSNQSPL